MQKLIKWLEALSAQFIVFSLFTIGIVASFISLALDGDFGSQAWWSAWLRDIAGQAWGAALIYVILKILDAQRRVQEFKALRLAERQKAIAHANESKLAPFIRQLRSQSHEEAVRAADRLRDYGWLSDGSLHGANLTGANLSSANLTDGDFEQVDFEYANLNEADLSMVNLQSAHMWYVNLRGADLFSAKMQYARLAQADLRDVDFSYVDLTGADLTGANLQGALNLQSAHFDEYTILPDGDTWTPRTNLNPFISGNWQPTDEVVLTMWRKQGWAK